MLEIAAGSVDSALAAQEGGADRVELCSDLDNGGVTPSYATIAVTRDRLKIPLYVLIRPRVGDFCYDDSEIDVMLRDIGNCVSAGCDGVVVGALTAGGDIDETVCKELIGAAGKLGVTFHRAYDVARDQAAALESIIALGCERVLTSGGEANALMGAERIAGFVEQTRSRLTIMAGAGLDPDNIRQVAQRSNAREFHGSARSLRMAAGRTSRELPGLRSDWLQTDVAVVRAMVEALRS